MKRTLIALTALGSAMTASAQSAVTVFGSIEILGGWPLGMGVAKTQSRASNSIGYLLPRNLGGVYGQVMVAAGEGTPGAKYTGGRIGYESGPLNVAAAYGKTPAGASDYTA